MGKHLFKIADWQVTVSFADESGANGMHLLPSYQPFSIGEDEALPQLLSMDVDDSLRPVRKSERMRIRVFDTGNGDTVVDRLPDGGYQYIIRDIFSADCALLICDATFSRWRWSDGMNERAQVGVYFTNGRQYLICFSCAVWVSCRFCSC